MFAAVAGIGARAVLGVFSSTHEIPSVTDEYSACPHLPERQSCRAHTALRKETRGAVRQGIVLVPVSGSARHVLPGRAHGHRAPRVVAELEARVQEIAGTCGDGRKMRAAPANSPPTMFAFPKSQGMPAHNHRAEQIHAGPAKDKRVRRQLKNRGGTRRMYALSAVFRMA